jgi:Tol biopolymer transport system component
MGDTKGATAQFHAVALLVLVFLIACAPAPTASPVPTPALTPTPVLTGRIISASGPTVGAGGIYVFDRRENKGQKIADFYAEWPSDQPTSPFAISPDQQKIAYFDAGQNLAVVNIETGESKALATAKAEDDRPRFLAWSPDGARLAFVSGGDLSVVGLDGSSPTRLVQHNEGIYQKTIRLAPGIGNPVWTTDGRSILFDDFYAPSTVTTPPGPIGFRALYLVDVSNGTKRPIPYADSIIIGPVRGTAKVLISDVGAARRQAETFQLITVDESKDTISSGEKFNTTNGHLDLREYRRFAWSPDGSKLAYIIEIANVESTLMLRDIQTDQESRLTSIRTGVKKLAWSPDGDTIAFAQVVDQDLELYGVSAKDGKTTKLGTMQVSGPDYRVFYIDWVR